MRKVQVMVIAFIEDEYDGEDVDTLINLGMNTMKNEHHELMDGISMWDTKIVSDIHWEHHT